MVIGGASAAWPLGGHAQQPAMPVVGFLSGRSLVSDSHLVAAFRRGLSENGYVEGQSVTIEFRWAQGQRDRVLELAADLVSRRVTVIFAGAVDFRIRAVRAAISTIPLVLATGGDPVALGLVASLNQPGGNATAVTVISAALWPKRLELLRGFVAPGAAIALLINPNNVYAESALQDVQAAARNIGQRLLVVNTRTEADFEPAFATIVREKASALLVADDALLINRRDRLVALAARHAVPAIYGRREFVSAGGLMSYGASTDFQYHQSGLYVGRILKGAKPADLPVMQPTRFELVINLRSATMLGLALPPTLLALADGVIE
jgi:putative ABC transport system substrate-binding protein